MKIRNIIGMFICVLLGLFISTPLQYFQVNYFTQEEPIPTHRVDIIFDDNTVCIEGIDKIIVLNGISMKPQIKYGELGLLQNITNQTLSRGMVVCYTSEKKEGLTCHRIIKVLKNKVIIKADNTPLILEFVDKERLVWVLKGYIHKDYDYFSED